MSKKTGTLIRKARAEAGLTQAQLARKVDGCSAADIGKAERGEKDLTQAQLRQIAKATGVTQSSLLESARSSKSGKSSSAKSSASQDFKLTNKEKELIRKYRKAGTTAQVIVGMILDKAAENASTSQKEDGSILQTLINAASGGSNSGSSSGKSDDLITNLLTIFGKQLNRSDPD